MQRSRKHSAFGISMTPLASALALALGVAGCGHEAQASTPPDRSDVQAVVKFLRHELTQIKLEIKNDPRWANRIRHSQLPHKAQPQSVAAILPVTTCVDDASSSTTAGTLRYSVLNAADHDQIDLSALACSSITLTQGALPVSVNNLTVSGSSSSNFVIDGNGTDRVFYHTGTGMLSLDYLTVRNGRVQFTGQPPTTPAPKALGARYGALGGCIYSAASVVLDHSIVTGCTATSIDNRSSGGGVYAYQLYMDASTLSGNTAIVAAGSTFTSSAQAGGGGAYAPYMFLYNNSQVTGNVAMAAEGFASGGGLLATANCSLVDSSVSGNLSQGVFAFGGGVTANQLNLQTSTLSANSAHGVAGTATGDPPYAVAVGGGGVGKYALDVQFSTVSGNVAQVSTVQPYSGATGGGIVAGFMGSSKPSLIAYSTIDNNQAQIGAGVLAKYQIMLAQSTISGNSAQLSGGGLALIHDSQSIFNSTISGNSAGVSGGGMYVYYSASVTMESTIVADNTSAIGADIYGSYNNSSSGTLTNGNVVQAGSPVTIAGSHNLVVGATNATLPGDTLSANPLLQLLADNGGPTRTQLLGLGSPAIGAGMNPNNYAFDQRGTGFPRTTLGLAHIGALQGVAVAAAAPATPTPTLSTWALGLLAGLLGWLGFRRRKAVPD